MASGGGGIAGRLYRGEVSVNFVRRQRMWYTISGLILLVSVIALLVRGLNFSVDFKGGAQFQFPDTASSSQGAISRVVTGAGGGDATVQHISGLTSQWSVQTAALTSQVSQNVANALAKAFDIAVGKISIQLVGPTWGSQITDKAIEALIIFLVVIVIYLTIAFEWRMALAAFVALLHDIVITVGVYALCGFQVSPTSVIGLLTILGYSLYDTVVVFDKVRENTAGILTTQRSTYSDAANLALNQTLVRSINTSATALIPVASILFVGAGLLGAGTLNQLALVLFVGMLSGTYSSICIATPVLADLKEREPKYKDLTVKVNRKLSGGRAAQRAAATRTGTATAVPNGPVVPAAVDPAVDPEYEADDAVPEDDAEDVTVPAAASAAPPSRRDRRSGSSSRAGAAALSAAPVPGSGRGNPPVVQAPETDIANLITAHVRDVHDYPQPGVLFKDITPLLGDSEAFGSVVEALSASFGPVDKVVGIEARGFILAAPVAYETRAGFVPVRKKGKLPSATYSREYELEYGSAVLEVHQDAFQAGDRVLIVDDVLATGGTARATADLVHQAGAEVVGLAVLMELSFLNGRKNIPDLDVRTLLVV